MSDEGFHEIQLNSKQVIFICMTAALVLVVAFLSGVLVGRGVRAEKDTPAAEAVAAIPAASDPVAGVPAPAATQAAAPPPTVAPPTPVDEDLTYEKRLGGKEAPKETLQPMTAPPPPAASPKESAKAAKDARKDAKDAAKPGKDAAAAKASAPAPPTKAAKPEASAFPEPAGSGYYLKIVAYRDRAQAESVAQRLSGKGYRSYIVPAGSLYSVRVGKYKSRKEADSARRRLEKEEQLKPLISH